MHIIETQKSTNTGRIAHLALRNSDIVVYGRAEAPLTVPPWPADHQPALLWPTENARPLEELKGGPPVCLLVPDGSWRQSARLHRRVAQLGDMPCVKPPPGAPSAYRLRTPPSPSSLSTLEAVARVLEQLEDDGARVRAQLERAQRLLVDRILWLRGDKERDDVEGGLPAGLQIHDLYKSHDDNAAKLNPERG